MLDFVTVAREFRSLVARRRELLTFLGSVFAAMGLVLRNALEGNLPGALAQLQRHVFAFYAVALLVPSLLLALRIAQLNGGMVLNGVLYARLMEAHGYPGGNPQRAARYHFLGASFLMFLMADLLAGFASALLAPALGLGPVEALAAAVVVVVLWFVMYLRFHHNAARFALDKAARDTPAPFERDDWREHLAGSLEDVNRDMIGLLAFAGLMVFSVFESLSGMGKLREHAELDPKAVQRYGPLVMSLLLTVSLLLSMATYLRLRTAVGTLSLQLDPSDRPFRPLRVTDSLLGYVLLAFLFGVAAYVLALVLQPTGDAAQAVSVGLGCTVLAIVAEQVTLLVMGRKTKLAAVK